MAGCRRPRRLKKLKRRGGLKVFNYRGQPRQPKLLVEAAKNNKADSCSGMNKLPESLRDSLSLLKELTHQSDGQQREQMRRFAGKASSKSADGSPTNWQPV